MGLLWLVSYHSRKHFYSLPSFRDEENKIIDEVMLTVKKQPKQEEHKPEMFKANPVPIESQIPLYNTIMAAKEER